MDEREKIAKEIVEKIIGDFTDRRGFRQEWDCIDDGIRKEIIEQWELLTWDVLKRHFV
jgi:hypothetical protein